MVRMAIESFDRPTDLKRSMLLLEKDSEDLINDVKLAIEIYVDFPLIQDDLRLACLRCICSEDAAFYVEIIENFPKIKKDKRATQSIEFYKNKTLDLFLGMESQDEHEYQGESESSKEPITINIDESGFSKADSFIEEDYGLIEASHSQNRTLNQLKDTISIVTDELNPEDSTKLLELVLINLLYEKKSMRAVRDFFVAALRTLGNNNPMRGVAFGEVFIKLIPDHRAMRSMVIFMRKADRVEDAIRLTYHQNFKHDQTTRVWQQQLIIKRKQIILNGKLKEKFDEYGDDYNGLSEFMDNLFQSMNGDLDIARYMYKYCYEIHSNIPGNPLANEVIRWGDALFSLEENIISNKNEFEVTEKSEDNTPIPPLQSKLERELRRIEDSASLQIGRHLTASIRNPLRFIGLAITFPILCLKLGFQKIGYKKTVIEIVPTQNDDPRNHSIVLFPTNGVGFGHFTRMYAIARSLRKKDPTLEIIFFTPMPTLHILYADDFPTYHLAGRYKHSDMSARQWNGLVEEMLTLVFETHKPKAFVFDGAFPYRGMLNAINAQNKMSKWWMRRGTFKKNKSIPAGSIETFDYIIHPQDTGEIQNSVTDSVPVTYNVPPITLIESDEMLSKEQARNALSVPQDAKVVYVQLGAGRINEIDSTVRIVIDSLIKDEDVYVVLGESLLGQRAMLAMDRVRVIRDYPNALFFKAFDASVQAGGYNSFHEMRRLHLPTLFIPNTETGMDDQLQRVLKAEEEGWGIVSTNDKKDIIRSIERVLQLGSKEAPLLANGAAVTADLIIEWDNNETSMISN